MVFDKLLKDNPKEKLFILTNFSEFYSPGVFVLGLSFVFFWMLLCNILKYCNNLWKFYSIKLRSI